MLTVLKARRSLANIYCTCSKMTLLTQNISDGEISTPGKNLVRYLCNMCLNRKLYSFIAASGRTPYFVNIAKNSMKHPSLMKMLKLLKISQGGYKISPAKNSMLTFGPSM